MGGPALLKAENAQVPDSLRMTAEAAAGRGQAAIYLLREGKVLAVFAVADAIREESREAIRALHARGIEVAMLTGDAQAVADAVAAELDIDTVFAQVLPEDKAAKVRELQDQGKKVAMVGDGVNDAPALATADIGIAIGAGTDVAVEAGHIVLVRSDPRDIPKIVELSRATYRKMLQNLWWAAGYNIFAIPLAAGRACRVGYPCPGRGAVLMSEHRGRGDQRSASQAGATVTARCSCRRAPWSWRSTPNFSSGCSCDDIRSPPTNKVGSWEGSKPRSEPFVGQARFGVSGVSGRDMGGPCCPWNRAHAPAPVRHHNVK
jgi:soluble P-type ATPase